MRGEVKAQYSLHACGGWAGLGARGLPTALSRDAVVYVLLVYVCPVPPVNPAPRPAGAATNRVRSNTRDTTLVSALTRVTRPAALRLSDLRWFLSRRGYRQRTICTSRMLIPGILV